MNVSAATTIHDLIEAYPYLLDWLAEYNSHFTALKNPALFATMARVATVEAAATMAGVPLDTFLDDVRTEIAHREIAAEETAGLSAMAAASAAAAAADTAAAAARQDALKDVIRKLHDGVPVDQVKAEFDQLIAGVDSSEIARMEQALIAEGMPVEDVMRLCDVHVKVFKESLDTKPSASVSSNHPLDAYTRENTIATRLSGEISQALTELTAASTAEDRARALAQLSAKLEELSAIAVHYTRKENQLFPALEAHSVEGPTKVMWALDDDIRGRLKTARALATTGDVASLSATLPETLTMIEDMVYKEDKILFPTALDLLTAHEWEHIAAGDTEIGYAWIEEPAGEAPIAVGAPRAAGEGGEMLLPLPTGALTLAQLDLLFRALPFDVTYVDANDRVRFYSEGERVFPRSPGAIGREVRNCHPPASLHKVEEILTAFKDGSKSVAEFWIEMGPKFIHIRYFALRDADGVYQGCLEVVQDATHVRALSGNRRIVDW